jgi:purine-binding chemotaxis protein CheW
VVTPTLDEAGADRAETAEAVPAAAAAAPDAAVEPAGVLIGIAGGRYAVPMAAVAEVGRVPRITRVPGVPVWVAGVANWRGRILPVVDLRPLLGGTIARPREVGPDGRLVVAGDGTVSVGLLVEAVDGVVAPPADLKPPPATISAEAAELLGGQWTDASGPIGLIDLAALLRLRHRLPRRGD